MSRMISNDQRSPSISIDAFRGHPDRRAGPGFFLATLLPYHITCNLQVIYAYCSCETASESRQNSAQAESVFSALAEVAKCKCSSNGHFWAARFGMRSDRFGIPWM